MQTRAHTARTPTLPARQDTVATICRVQRERGVSDTSLLNYVVSDGVTMVATRFVSPEGGAAATLYYAEGAVSWRARGPRGVSAACLCPCYRGALLLQLMC